MRKLFGILGLLGVLVFSPGVLAHTLESAGSVGAVMHISPEDDPVAEEQSGFFFEFKDKENKFNPQNCVCTFSILKEDQEIFSQPLFANNSDPSLQNASVFFTFPEKNVYKIKVSGKPKVEGSFNEFNLEYDVRVAKISNGVKPIQANPYGIRPIFFWGSIILFGLVIVVLSRQSKSRR